MARIPYFDPTQAEGRARKAYTKLPDLNIFRMLGHSGDMIDNFTKLGNSILVYGDLNPVLREIAIVRTGVLRRSSYEVHQHEAISRKLGMTDDLIAAITAERVQAAAKVFECRQPGISVAGPPEE
jgi:Carboxymuconolactone decarboxylase family.